MLRLLEENDVAGLIEQASTDLLLLGVNLFYMVSAHTEALTRATRDRGVRLQAHMVDDESPFVQTLYGEDGLRDHLRGTRAHTFSRLGKTRHDLESIHRALAQDGHSDRLEVWFYQYASLYSVVAVDVGSDAGRLLVSPHLYLEEAKNPPVLDLTHAESPVLYETYWRDVEQFTRRVKRRSMIFS